MPLDSKFLAAYDTYTNQPGIPPPKNKLKTVEPSVLRDLLLKEKTLPKKSKIVFIDCQSNTENTGSQFEGAIHMDITSATLSKSKFKAVIQAKPDVYKKIAAADLVVFYCMHANSRSPKVMDEYLQAVKDIDSRPATYNEKQAVRLLVRGISDYEDVTEFDLVKYVTKPKTIQAGLVKTPQAGSDKGKTHVIPQSQGDDFEIY